MRARTIAAASLLAVALALSACGVPGGIGVVEATPAPALTPRPTPVVDVPVARATPEPAIAPVAPTRVVADSISVDMRVSQVGVEEGGFMEIPEDPATAGWYRFGADPARGEGNVVISAHVDAPGEPIGPFSRLRDLSADDVVTVTDAAGARHDYRVSSVTYFPKDDLPVQELFRRSGSPELVLITCGGAFDAATGRYADNVVAVANPVD